MKYFQSQRKPSLLQLFVRGRGKASVTKGDYVTVYLRQRHIWCTAQPYTLYHNVSFTPNPAKRNLSHLLNAVHAPCRLVVHDVMQVLRLWTFVLVGRQAGHRQHEHQEQAAQHRQRQKQDGAGFAMVARLT